MYFIKTINHSIYLKSLPLLRNVKSAEELGEKLSSNNLTLSGQEHIGNTLFLIKKDLHKYALSHFFTNVVIASLSFVLLIIFALKGGANFIEYAYIFLIISVSTVINKLIEGRVLKLANKKHRKLLLIEFAALTLVSISYMMYTTISIEGSIFTYLPLIIIICNAAYFVRYFIKLEDDIYEEDVCGFQKQQLRTNLERGFTLIWAINLFFVMFTGSANNTSSIAYFFFFIFIISTVAMIYHGLHYKYLHKLKPHHLA